VDFLKFAAGARLTIKRDSQINISIGLKGVSIAFTIAAPPAYFAFTSNLIAFWIPVSVSIISICSFAVYAFFLGHLKNKKTRNKVRFSIFALLLIVHSLLLLFLYLKHPKYIIEDTRHEIEIKASGKMQWVQSQILNVNAELDRFVGSDFGGDGKFDYRSFKWCIRELITTEPLQFNLTRTYKVIFNESDLDVDGRFFVIHFDPPLESGKFYEKLCTLSVIDAFPSDRDDDWLSIDCNNAGTHSLIRVSFEAPRFIEPQSACLQQLKRGGEPIQEVKHVVPRATESSFEYTFTEDRPGNRYRFAWVYKR
jgi:hypothetical protein